MFFILIKIIIIDRTYIALLWTLKDALREKQEQIQILTEHLSYHLQHPPLLLLNKIPIWRQPIQTGFKQINKTFVDLLSVLLCIQEHYCDFLFKVNPRTMCFWQHDISKVYHAFSYEITQTWCIKNLLVVNLLCWSFYSTLHHSLLPKCHNKK